MKSHLPFALASILCLAGGCATFAALPTVPGTNEVVRYEYEGYYEQYSNKPQLYTIPREWGDTLLAALDGGRQVRERVYHPTGDGTIVIDPAEPQYLLNITLTDGKAYRIGLFSNGSSGCVDFPERNYQITDAVQTNVVKLVHQLDADLRQRIVSAPRPLVYTVGTVDDGGTLSGIARLFYGDASKWPQIYAANRQVVKNPNIISGRMKLTIPKLTDGVNSTTNRPDICEVHHVQMEKRTVPIAGGNLPYDANRERFYPHPGDYAPGGCFPGSETNAIVYVCPKCEAALRAVQVIK